MIKSFLLKALVGAMVFLIASTHLGIAKEMKKAKTSAEIASEKSQEMTAQQQYDHYFNLANNNLGEFNFEESIKYCEKTLEYKPEDYLVRAIMCLNYYELAEQLKVQYPEQKKGK